jgi:hypothetical protein
MSCGSAERTAHVAFGSEPEMASIHAMSAFLQKADIDDYGLVLIRQACGVECLEQWCREAGGDRGRYCQQLAQRVSAGVE